MDRSARKRKEYDLRTAIVAADAFCGHAQLFITFVGTDMETAHHRASQQIGELIASATELAFAVELYLKVLWMRLGLQVPETHHLWSLFKDLPNSELKKSIIQSYDRLNCTGEDGVADLQIAVSVGPMQDEQLERAEKSHEKKPHDPSLKGVLVRSSNGFQTWRYLFEQGLSGEVRFVEYEFARLKMVASVVREHGSRGLTLAKPQA